MKRQRSIASLVPVVVVVIGIYVWRHASQRFEVIEYRGQTFKLAHAYSDWEDYKEDYKSNPLLAPDQVAAAQGAVESGPIAATFASRDAMIRDVCDLEFPGFGMAVFGERPQADGSMLAGFAISVPQADKDRVLVYRGRNGTWTLVADFVWTPQGAIMRVDDKGGRLEFSSFDGRVVVSREVQ